MAAVELWIFKFRVDVFEGGYTFLKCLLCFYILNFTPPLSTLKKGKYSRNMKVKTCLNACLYLKR